MLFKKSGRKESKLISGGVCSQLGCITERELRVNMTKNLMHPQHAGVDLSYTSVRINIKVYAWR